MLSGEFTRGTTTQTYRLDPRNTKRSPNLSVILNTILPSEVHDGKSMILVGSVNARTSLGVPPSTAMT